MRKTSLLCLSLVAFSCAPFAMLPIQAAPTEAFEEKSVGRIDVTLENAPPHFSFDPKTVVSRLKTKMGDPFSQSTFDSDLKALSDEYDRVEPLIDVMNGEVYITLKLWPRPSIRTIQWEGNQHFKTKKLQKELGLKPSSTFNRQTFNKAFNKLKEFYIKEGYFESELDYRILPDARTNEVDIVIHVTEGRSGKIDQINFKGFTKEEKSAILEMVHTKKYNLFTYWFLGSGIYNEDALEQDRLTIMNFLQNEGYADAKVDVKISASPKEGKIVIDIEANRGVIFHFGEITFDGNTLFSDEKIEAEFLARPDGIYSPETLRETSQAIKDLYGRKGYIDASVQYEVHLNENAPIYNVHFQIEEGQQYKIGMIHIIGNTQTQERVILHESLLIPGETFDSAKLKATQQRLENIGYFKQVNVYAVRTQEDQSLGENFRDVFIEVEETHTGNVSLFAGFSSADNIFGGLDLSESNFNFSGITKIFDKGFSAVRGGGEFAHARVNFGAKQRTYTLAWMTPYLRDTLWRFGFNAEKMISNLQSNDYTINTLGLTIYASYPLSTYWAFGTKYRIKNDSISFKHNHHISKKEKETADKEGMVSGVGVSLTYDSTDSALKPHRGIRSMMETEYTGIGGDFTFFRFGYVNNIYQYLWPRGTMKYRAEFRFIAPVWKTSNPDDIPLAERFFLGGESSVRGYRAFDLGPRLGNKDDPSGGISSTLFSVEYSHELLRMVDLFGFIDGGNVSMQRFRVGYFNMSYGVGTRIELINRVPVTLGYGFPVNPKRKEQVKHFFFTMGGQF